MKRSKQDRYRTFIPYLPFVMLLAATIVGLWHVLRNT